MCTLITLFNLPTATAPITQWLPEKHLAAQESQGLSQWGVRVSHPPPVLRRVL